MWISVKAVVQQDTGDIAGNFRFCRKGYVRKVAADELGRGGNLAEIKIEIFETQRPFWRKRNFQSGANGPTSLGTRLRTGEQSRTVGARK